MHSSLHLALLALAPLLAAPVSAQCPNDDVYEDNDTPATAATLPLGLTTGLSFHGVAHPSGEDIDYWRIPAVAVGDRVSILVTNISGTGPITARLSPTVFGAETIQLGTVNGVPIELTNNAGVAQDYVLSIESIELSSVCEEYSLDLSITADPCSLSGPDPFENNDDCNQSVALVAGSYVGLQMTPEDPDFYSIDVPHGYGLTVDQIDTGSFRGLALNTSPLCPGSMQPFLNPDLQIENNGPAGARSVMHTNESGSTQTVYLRSLVWSDSCARYDLVLTLTPGACVSATDDAFEPNDDCSSAAALPAGTYTDLFADKLNSDHYRIDVPPAQVLSVDQTSAQSPFVHAAELFGDSLCTTPIGWSATTDLVNRAVWKNDSPVTASVYLKCSIRPQAADGCGTYDLNVTTVLEDCTQTGLDDTAEDNETCATAAPIHWGNSYELFVSEQDPDVYEFTIQDGEFFVTSIKVHNPLTDLEYYVFDDPASCGNLANGWVAHYYDPAGMSGGSVGWTNQTGSAQTYYLLVRVPPTSVGGCTSYDLFARYPGGPPLSNVFCVGDGTAGPRGSHDVACPCGNASTTIDRAGCVNSQGQGATLRCDSAGDVSDGNGFQMQVAQARPNMPAMLVQGRTLIAVPFKDGILCMGNPTERIEVLFLSATGTGQTASDIAAESHVLPGDQSYYQVWYRDPAISTCGTGSNFTNGVAVRWE